MNFIDSFGCKKNCGLEDLGYSLYQNDTFCFDKPISLDNFSNEVEKVYQHYKKEINDIANCKDVKERFDHLCLFLKEKSTFEYLLGIADIDYNGKHYDVCLWNIKILIQQKYIERFNVSKNELYLNYCNLIDKIAEGAFACFGDDDMTNDCDHEAWKCEIVTEIFMLPNGWFVCECDNIYIDDQMFYEYLYYDENLLFVGSGNDWSYDKKCWNSDIIDCFWEFQNTEDFKNHKAEKISKIQAKYEKNDIVISRLGKDDYDNLVGLYKREITDIRNYVYKRNCQWIQKCCETISIIMQQLCKVDRKNIKLLKSIERDLHIDAAAKNQLLKEIEKVFDIELDENKFMDTDTIKDLFELVVYTIKKLEGNIQLQNF